MSEALVDVVFLRTGPEGPFDRATWLDRVFVARYGGEIVYTFNSNAARVRIATKDVPRLGTAPFVSILMTVPDARRYDWPVIVFFRREHRYTPNDVVKFVRLGGRIAHYYHTFNGFAGLLPDNSLPVLRADPNIAQAEGAPPFACWSCGARDGS